jgi:DNA polymerase III alpha subunit
MKQNNVGELIYTEDDVCDLIMKGHTAADLAGMIIDSSVELKYLVEVLDSSPNWRNEQEQVLAPETFHTQQQATWYMPVEYKNMDIAAHILGLCNTEAELQRCGKELLLYQERDLFNLLRFMVYMVDVMTEHKIVWGVGRGSSVASYVLYKLKVHQIDSIYYNLDVEEFLR